MRGNLNWLWLPWLRILDSSEVEELIEFLLIELLSELINSCNSELSSEGVDSSLGLNLVAGQVVVTDEVLTGLVDCEALRKLLSLEHESEGVAAIVGMMDFTDLTGVVSEVVMDDEGEIVTLHEETEDLSVIVEELLLGRHSAST